MQQVTVDDIHAPYKPEINHWVTSLYSDTKTGFCKLLKGIKCTSGVSCVDDLSLKVWGKHTVHSHVAQQGIQLGEKPALGSVLKCPNWQIFSTLQSVLCAKVSKCVCAWFQSSLVTGISSGLSTYSTLSQIPNVLSAEANAKCRAHPPQQGSTPVQVLVCQTDTDREPWPLSLLLFN